MLVDMFLTAISVVGVLMDGLILTVDVGVGVAISFLIGGFPRQCAHWLGMTVYFN